MKFKLIFLIFSFTLLIAFVVLLMIPLILLGFSFALSYWRANWLLVFIWPLFFAALFSFYFANRQLFTLLEKEDWPALVRYLEDRIIQKGRYSSRLVRLLANSYLVLSDTEAVISLENKTALARPALLDSNVLVFGTARILGRDFSGALRFFDAHRDRAKKSAKEWVCFYLAFALLLDRQFVEAANEFSVLSRLSKDFVVSALSSFFLAKVLTGILDEKEGELLELASRGKERVKTSLPEFEKWKNKLSRLPAEIHIAAISKYLEETGFWLYS